MKTIYLVEDEEKLRDLMVTYLREAGYSVTAFSNGLNAKGMIKENPDLWVLDIMVPGMDGFALIKEIRGYNPNIPVIFVSARNAELDRVIGLEMGSDDYLPKPFLPRELVLRVNRLIQRSMPIETSPVEAEAITHINSYCFDRSLRSAFSGDEQISLTTKEFDILDFFISHTSKALSRDEIIDAIWGQDYFGSSRVVDDTIRRIRKKMPELSLEPIYGFGYILKGDETIEKA